MLEFWSGSVTGFGSVFGSVVVILSLVWLVI